ncbi:MAG: sigma-70 family RNA polymerase sigma factor [Clostridia bacterium]|nr:sigma-70 family RNA polymerase sigma factor [Clostridia bacterium]
MDEILINEYLSGKDESLSILIDRYKKPLYKLCFNLVRNNFEADDLFQETWIKIIKCIRRYKSKNFKSFLYKVCINTYKDQYRKNKRQKNLFQLIEDELYIDRLNQSQSSNCESILVNKEQCNHMMKNLNLLKDHYRIPIILFYFEGLQYSKIAEVMDISLGTVKSRISKGKEKLKESMEVSYHVI